MAPIGIFDSGIGGLTVLKALKLAMPTEAFVYLGDTARLPYGSKSPQTIERYLYQNMGFLRSHKVKAIVVACNTASTVLHDESWDGVPVYGVIKPGAHAAVCATRKQKVGVLGTRATVASGAYQLAIQAENPQIQVFSQACPLLVPLVEEGWEADPITKEILKRYMEEILGQDIDTLVLGCTHYPVLKEPIQEIVGPGIRLIDSAQVMADRLKADIQSGKIADTEMDPSLRIWTTDLSDAFQRVGNRILSPLHVDHWSLADIR